MGDFACDAGPTRAFTVPTILVIETSMSAGKTMAASVVVRRLKRTGHRVVAGKLSGAGRYRDIPTFSDAGADAVFDFVDAGLPSTVCPEETYRRRIGITLTKMADACGDVAVVEIGASPLEPYNGSVAVEALREVVKLTVLCASDPYAVVGVMKAFTLEPDLVTGVASNTRAGIELVEKLTALPCLNVRDRRSHAALDRLLEERF